jgi:ubiquinone/menaquinone biosynthesis C-methylase UbiE
VEGLLALFGGDAVYAAGLILAVILVLVIWAFWQGREINFWPPRIGLRPDRTAAIPLNHDHARAMLGPRRRPSSRPADPAKFMEVFGVAEAARFYQLIAPNYDQRNSVNLLATHMEVIIRIEQARRQKPALRILDLGGGTGQNVATYFFNDRHVRWTYVDSSPAMLRQLQRHLAGRRLYERLSVLLADIHDVHQHLPAQAFDVVLLNLVLTSMPDLPDFTGIAGLLAPGGQLIIADIDPRYTNQHPYYAATAADGARVAMRMQPVHPLDVVSRAGQAGLRPGTMTPVGPDAVSYAFVISFTRPAQPGERRPGRGSGPAVRGQRARPRPAARLA